MPLLVGGEKMFLGLEATWQGGQCGVQEGDGGQKE